MGGSQTGRVGRASGGRLAALVGAVAVAAILAVARPAAAHEGACPELWNPHGQTTPPAGSTTLPGAAGGMNEDGFYQLIMCAVAGTLQCPEGGLGGPVFAAPCTCVGSAQTAVVVYDAGDGCSLPRAQWVPIGTFSPDEDGFLVIKYTEKNGATPGFKDMAGNNSPAGDNEAMAVDWHVWGQGDFVACSASDPNACTGCCLVPEPPK